MNYAQNIPFIAPPVYFFFIIIHPFNTEVNLNLFSFNYMFYILCMYIKRERESERE